MTLWDKIYFENGVSSPQLAQGQEYTETLFFFFFLSSFSVLSKSIETTGTNLQSFITECCHVTLMLQCLLHADLKPEETSSVYASKNLNLCWTLRKMCPMKLWGSSENSEAQFLPHYTHLYTIICKNILHSVKAHGNLSIISTTLSMFFPE